MMKVIKLKRSELAGIAPSVSDLQAGEIAVNITDGKFYSKTTGNVIVEVANTSGTYTAADRLSLELQEQYKTANASHFKELTYGSGLLTNVSIWTDSGKTTKLFNKDLSYGSGLLTSMVITRITDSATLTKTLTYSSGVLQDIDIVAV